METEVMLTTFDNPFDPFDEFNLWLLYDKEQGYNTCEFIARLCKDSSEFSTIEEKRDTERAIDDIIMRDDLNIYKKVTRESKKEEENESETEETED